MGGQGKSAATVLLQDGVSRAARGLIAETVSYATNQRSNSVVTVQDGRLSWQDSSGADVNVGVAESGDLVGTAVSAGAKLEIVFKPRP